MINPITEAYTPKKLTATGQVFTGNGSLIGFLCTTAGSLALANGTGAGTNVVADFDVAEGGWYPIPFTFDSGCYATLTTAQGTFGYAQ